MRPRSGQTRAAVTEDGLEQRVLVPIALLGVASLVILMALPDDEPGRLAPAVDASGLTPPPTEHLLAVDAERNNKASRKAWFREVHRAPPGVEYKLIERRNGLAQVAKRNALAAAPPPPDGASWTERGSINQSGRMHAAAHSPDHATLYGGSALGGVWKSDLAGTTWTPIGDNLYGGAHWLAVNTGEPGEPDVVLAATDWGQVRVTRDDGATWLPPDGLDGAGQVRRVLTLTDGSEAVFALTERGGGYDLSRSTDGIETFDAVYDLGGFAGDLWAPRTGGGDLFLLTADGVQVSGDAGETWASAGPLPDGDWTRGELAGSEAGAPRLWAVLSGDGVRHLVRSDDAGASWTTVLETVDDYWGALNASIEDADRFAWGGVEVHRTRDGGDGFDVVNAWSDYYGDIENKLHADIMGIEVFTGEAGEELWYIATDGGLYRSTDRLDTVENLSLSGLRVSQYYDTHTSSRNPDHVIAGSQDQGWQVTTGVEQSGGILAFDQTISGDYGHLTSGDGSHELVFGVYPGFILVHLGETDPALGYIEFPDGENQAWLPPVVADPDAPESFFFCATRLWYYRYEQGELVWEPELWSDHDFGEADGEYLSAFAMSPVSPDRAWAATNYGRLFRSDDRGRTWTRADDDGPYAHYFYGSALLPSKTDPDVLMVGGSGYGGPAVYRSEDGGETWAPWADGLPDTTVYGLAEAPDGSGRVVAGTSTAAYRRDPGDSEWRDITGADAPVTAYWSAESLPHENTVRFGTYGRGIWDYAFEPSGDCTFGEDADGDGVPCQDDCDDSDPLTYPGADDVCDGIDRDCNPDVPEEFDEDGDGYPSCDDCNDRRDTTYPGAPEVCGNGIDENCDGEDSPNEACEGSPGDDDDESGGGCGCASGAGGAGGLGLVVLVGLAARRRRQA